MADFPPSIGSPRSQVGGIVGSKLVESILISFLLDQTQGEQVLARSMPVLQVGPLQQALSSGVVPGAEVDLGEPEDVMIVI